MTYCRRCPHLCNDDPDGMVLTCALSGQRCYLDNLPWTTMSECPLKKQEAGVGGKDG